MATISTLRSYVGIANSNDRADLWKLQKKY